MCIDSVCSDVLKEVVGVVPMYLRGLVKGGHTVLINLSMLDDGVRASISIMIERSNNKPTRLVIKASPVTTHPLGEAEVVVHRTSNKVPVCSSTFHIEKALYPRHPSGPEGVVEARELDDLVNTIIMTPVVMHLIQEAMPTLVTAFPC